MTTNRQDELFHRAKALVQEWLKSRVGDVLEDHRRLVALISRELRRVDEETQEGRKSLGGWPE
jgi:chemotaxis regulatin CheY-phosphate phosphatase CheZ